MGARVCRCTGLQAHGSTAHADRSKAAAYTAQDLHRAGQLGMQQQQQQNHSTAATVTSM